jgi:hypothetical protein
MISKKIGLLFLIMLSPMASASDPVLTGETAAKDLAELQLNAKVGEVEIRGTETDRVRWRVELEPQKSGWFTSTAQVREKLDEIKVRSETDGTILHLELDYPDDLDDDDVKHRWHIEVPAAFAVNVKHGVGELNVADVKGGVNGKLGVGNASVIVPAGNVVMDVGTGNASVVSATNSVGNIELHSGLGNASARIRGKELASNRPGLKTDLNQAGDGNDHYRISVGVGNAELVIKN